VVYISAALADHVRGNLSSCLQADVVKHAGVPVTNNPSPHINAELLLMSAQNSFSNNPQIKYPY
jgi:hypothetical protein